MAQISTDLPPRPGENVLIGGGGALLPGLADHHAHLWATAGARASIDLAGSTDLESIASIDGEGWLRIVGVGKEFSREQLDRLWPQRPVRVQHRSGALWSLNSPAVELIKEGLDEGERRTGQLWRADSRLRSLIGASRDEYLPELVALGRQLAMMGITRVTDATPDLDPAALSAVRRALPQRVMSMSRLIPEPSPLKIVLGDHALPTYSELVQEVGVAHESGRPVALHAVSSTALVLALTAVKEVGTLSGDRIEHAAVCDDPLADQLAALGLTVVTQPSIWTRHGDTYMRDTPESEWAKLWRYASLLAHGVRVAVSSDAPYGDLNPWRTIRSATHRRLDSGIVASERECVEPETVLRSLLAELDDPGGPARVIRPGDSADLTLLSETKARALALAANTGESCVVATFIEGRQVAP